MKINRGSKVAGFYFEMVPGQHRFAFGRSDSEDFYDMKNRLSAGGYQGLTIRFMDVETGTVYEPVVKERNVMYGEAVWFEGYLYFLKGDFNEGRMELLRYLPGGECECVRSFEIDSLDLYNLRLYSGDHVYVTSQNVRLTVYDPVSLSIPMDPHESLMHIEDGKLYLSAWVEEGVSEGRITDRYRYYEKLIIKDLDGHTLSEETGSLNRFPDGRWWLT